MSTKSLQSISKSSNNKMAYSCSAEQWQQQRTWNVGQSKRKRQTGVTGLCFDPYEELMWFADQSGHLTSLLNTPSMTDSDARIGLSGYSTPPGSLMRYSAFPVGNSAKTVIACDQGIVTATDSSVQMTSRRGVKWWRRNLANVSCVSLSDTGRHNQLLVATDRLTSLNLFDGSVLREIDLPDSDNSRIVKMKTSRMACHATDSGYLLIRDPKSFKVQHEFKPHSAAIADMDVSGLLLMTCGYSHRNSKLILDPLVKLYDLRMMKALSPIPVMGGASHVLFHPTIKTHIYAFSPNGNAQMCDTSSINYSHSFFFRPMADYHHHTGLLPDNHAASVSAVDISSNGEVLCVANTMGVLSFWSESIEAAFNAYSRESEYYSLLPDDHTVPYIPIDPAKEGHVPFSSVGMPYYTSQLLSACPASLYTFVGRQSPRVPPEMIKNMKTVDFVGYTKNPGIIKRNQNLIMMSRSTIEDKPKFVSQRHKDARNRFPSDDHSLNKLGDVNDSVASLDTSVVPVMYRAVEIKYSRFGVEDFDFAFYNKTQFGGLETHIKCSYMNSLLQTLFFTVPLREYCKLHIRASCIAEPCFACELAFLFRMLEDSRGSNCQASNFLKAFRSTSQVSALGLVDPETQPNPAYRTIIQTACRFLLDRLHQEISSKPGGLQDVVKRLFSISLSTLVTCQAKHDQTIQSSPFVIDLPKKTQDEQSPSFTALLQRSFGLEETTRAWCSKCNRYQIMRQKKHLRSFPFFLIVNTNISNDNEVSNWCPTDTSTCDGFVPTKMCIKLVASSTDSDTTPYAAEIVDISNTVDSELPEQDEFTAIYHLQAVISSIKEKDSHDHLCASINVSEAPHEPGWHVFNDFQVQPIQDVDEVSRMTTWKVPAVVQYARMTRETTHEFFSSPVEPDYSMLIKNPLLNKLPVHMIKSKYVLMRRDEVPRCPGYVCAIDAEFVSVSKGEIEVRSDGTKSVLRPAQSALARVSVVRGVGDQKGVAFIDDYINITEHVVDYLTEYSGIKPGDLDPQHSVYPLVSLKTSYKKLRLLVDLGCKFVGHGLTKDVRTINILIPKDQIIDTVDIFYIKRHGRKLSLRFLMWYMFNEDIQSNSHDSIEDAFAALRIYDRYVELNDAGQFDKYLEKMYEDGRLCNFKPVEGSRFHK